MRKYQFQSQAAEGSSAQAVFPVSVHTGPPVGRKPKILMVGMHLTKTRGGITTLTASILNSSLRQDYDFIYIASQAEEFGKIRKALLALSAIIRFVGSCLWTRPGLIYVHLGSNASLYRESIFILLAKLFGKRVLTHFHAGDIDEYFPRQPAIGKRFILTALSISDTVIAVSVESATQLRRICKKINLCLIPNTIDTSVFDAAGSSPREDRPGPLRLLFVGAVGKLKGEIDLIKALSILKKKGLDLKVSFIGYDAETLAPICHSHGVFEFVECLGPVSMQDRISYFEQADIFVLPTYAEAMPLSVIEAMAAGLPIISTTVGGIPEIVANGKEGYLVPAGDIIALAENIGLLVGNKEVRIKMGKNARKRACEELDFKTYIDQLLAVITKISSAKK